MDRVCQPVAAFDHVLAAMTVIAHKVYPVKLIKITVIEMRFIPQSPVNQLLLYRCQIAVVPLTQQVSIAYGHTWEGHCMRMMLSNAYLFWFGGVVAKTF